MSTDEIKTKDFFISYNKADRQWAEWIAWQLEKAGFSVFIQAWDFRPGTNFVLEMERAARASRGTIAVISPDYMAALYTQSEWASAFAADPTGEKRTLIPVRVRDCELHGLAASIVYIDLVGRDKKAALQSLLDGVAEKRAKPESAPAFPGEPSPEPSFPHGPPTPPKAQKIELYFMYSSADQRLRDELALHLRVLERAGVVNKSSDRCIDSEQDWTDDIDIGLERANLILPLVSAHFLSSDYCFGSEMKRALEMHAAGDARVIPIILRPVDWQESPIGAMQALPRDEVPIASWPSRDEAFSSVANGIRLACQELRLVLPPRSVVPPEKSFPLHEVFKPSGVPTITFVEPEGFYKLRLALSHPGRGVVIEGPSGIGKTTALKMALAAVQSRTGDMSPVEILSARKPNELETIRLLTQRHRGLVAIDDFHRLPEELRDELADYLKYLADQELPSKQVVIVGIPGTGKHLVDLAYDLATRIDRFKLGRVSDEIVLSMIAKGERALNIRFDRKTEIARAAAGSLNIAQLLCSHLAARDGIEGTLNTRRVVPCFLQETIAEILEQLTLKFADLVRSFAAQGGGSDLTCIELLQELAHAEGGFLSLAQLADRRSDLVPGLERLIQAGQLSWLTEESSDHSDHLLYDESRRALIIDDPQLTFFLRQLPVQVLLRDVGKSEEKERSKIFISYSHPDKRWLDRIRVHLKPLERDGLLDIWDDTSIKPGVDWRKEIDAAINSAKYAILLVSADFLASDFIAENELPPLLSKRQEGGTQILTIIVSPCLFSETELTNYQSLNDPQRPLSSMNRSEQEAVFVKLARAVIREDKQLPSSFGEWAEEIGRVKS